MGRRGKENRKNMDMSEEKSLVIDQIIDNFGDDELLDEDTEEDKSEYNNLVMCDEDDEENSIGEEESMIIETEPDPEAFPGLDVKSQSKYGKLWQFIRDLLRNERFNPSIIKWENIEEGEFRIVDSLLLAKLWATVKENKKNELLLQKQDIFYSGGEKISLQVWIQSIWMEAK